MEKQTSVYIAEDHQMLREGLKAILSMRRDLKIVGEAVDGLEAIRGVKRHKPDLMLLDLSMPRMSGISVLMEAKAWLMGSWPTGNKIKPEPHGAHCPSEKRKF